MIAGIKLQDSYQVGAILAATTTFVVLVLVMGDDIVKNNVLLTISVICLGILPATYIALVVIDRVKSKRDTSRSKTSDCAAGKPPLET